MTVRVLQVGAAGGGGGGGVGTKSCNFAALLAVGGGNRLLAIHKDLDQVGEGGGKLEGGAGAGHNTTQTTVAEAWAHTDAVDEENEAEAEGDEDPQIPGLFVVIHSVNEAGERGEGVGVGTRQWWLALLACGGAYWPLALEPSAMTMGMGGGGEGCRAHTTTATRVTGRWRGRKAQPPEA